MKNDSNMTDVDEDTSVEAKPTTTCDALQEKHGSKQVADYLGTMAPGRLPKQMLSRLASEDPGFIGALFCERCYNHITITSEGLAIFLGWCHDKFGADFVFNPQTHYFSMSICPNCDQPSENAAANIVEAF